MTLLQRTTTLLTCILCFACTAENSHAQSKAAPFTTYYVSPMGADSNGGTSKEQPFQVVQYAVDQMSSGDTLIVLDGLYTGTLKLKSGITIRAENPRKAIFSGVQVLKVAFEPHEGGIYKAKVSKNIKQLFFDDKPMAWAQWPNVQWSENWIGEKKWALATEGTGPGVLTSEEFKSIKNLDLTGGYTNIRYGKGNSNYSRRILSFDGAVLHWNDDDFYTQKFTGEDGRRGSTEALKTLPKKHPWHPNKSKFFLSGDLDLLDAPGEWFAEGGTLYVYPLDGKNPNKAKILTKTIDYCVDEKKAVADVTLDGINFFGCSVRLSAEDNSNISIHNVHFSYIGAELLFVDRVQGAAIDKPIHIAGSKIKIEKCLFAGAQNTALTLVGDEITVQNSVFIENNRHANFESRAFALEANGTYKISNNTFFNNHSDAISIISRIKNPLLVNPEISYNNIFNGGKYNSDVSGIYMPSGSQAYADVHHNWVHNMNGNAFRLDLAGKELSLHHNVFWASKRGINVEGYGQFNIYNNTDVHNHTASMIIRNVLNHSGKSDASLDKTFPPIADWNVINNLTEGLDDRVGPREKKLFNAQYAKKRTHPLRSKSSLIPVVDRGSIQGNLTGVGREIFAGGDLSGLNLVPIDSIVKGGVTQNAKLAAEGVTSLDTYRGAYDYNDAGWTPGSNWMPYGLDVLSTMAMSEQFAKKYYSLSIVPEMKLKGLQQGYLNEAAK